MYRTHGAGLGSAVSDLLKIGGGLMPKGGGDAAGDVVGSAGGSVATAVFDSLYAKEQVRMQNLMDHSDQVMVKAGQAIDWGKWAVAGLAAAGVYYLVKRARRA